MKRVVLVAIIAAATVSIGQPAVASCHAFKVSSMSNITEGEQVSVIVERDGTRADSSVRVRTVNGSAKAPADFTAFDERITFTGDQMERTITFFTEEDKVDEATESFKIAISDAQGCTQGSVFQYGEAATVTIVDDDEGSAATAEPAATRTPVPTTTTVVRTGIPTASPAATPDSSPTPTPSTSATASPAGSPFAVPSLTPGVTEEDGGFPWLPVAAVVGLLAAAGGAFALQRMRQNSL